MVVIFCLLLSSVFFCCILYILIFVVFVVILNFLVRIFTFVNLMYFLMLIRNLSNINENLPHICVLLDLVVFDLIWSEFTSVLIHSSLIHSTLSKISCVWLNAVLLNYNWSDIPSILFNPSRITSICICNLICLTPFFFT